MLNRYIQLLRGAASNIYDHTAPTPVYADRVFWLLLMTACHESDHFKARRQYSFWQTPMEHRGAFGLMQCECASISESLDMLVRRPGLLHHVTKWFESESIPMFPIELGSLDHVLHLIMTPEGDACSIVLGRLHYFRVLEPVPATIPEMAAYAKYWYNSSAGKATAYDYVADTLDTLRMFGAL